MEPAVYYEYCGVNPRSECPDYQGVLIFQVMLYKGSFEIIAKCVSYAGVFITKCPDEQASL